MIDCMSDALHLLNGSLFVLREKPDCIDTATEVVELLLAFFPGTENIDSDDETPADPNKCANVTHIHMRRILLSGISALGLALKVVERKMNTAQNAHVLPTLDLNHRGIPPPRGLSILCKASQIVCCILSGGTDAPFKLQAGGNCRTFEYSYGAKQCLVGLTTAHKLGM